MHSKMLRVNFIIPYLVRRGGTIAIYEIANRLQDRNYDVTITTLAGEFSWFPLKVKVNYITRIPNKRLARVFDNLVRAYRGFRGRYTASSLFYFNRLLKINLGTGLDLIPYLAENIPDCDVNVATGYSSAFAVYLSGKGRPYHFLQDFPSMIVEHCDVHGDICLKMFELSLRLPFYFLTNSMYTRDLVMRHQQDAKIKVVGVGVDDETFYKRKKNLLERIQKPKVMALIRAEPKHKGAEVAVKVINKLNKKLPVHAVLVGSHLDVSKVFSSIKPEFTYICVGTVSHEKLANLYSSADLFLFTSYVESFGLPPLEAMACGSPVVSTDCLGNRDYANNGYNCLLTPPGDVEELTEASLRVLTNSDLADRLVRGGLETAKHFTWDKVVDRFEEALRAPEEDNEIR